MRNIRFVFTCIGILGLLFATGGCAPKPAVNLLWATFDAPGPGSDEVHDPVKAGFEKRHPNIKVEIQYNIADEQLIAAFAAGNGPDVFLYWDLSKFHAAGMLMDVTDRFNKDKLKKADFFPVAFAGVEKDGKIWGLPQSFGPRAVYYNKDLFDAAGVPYPERGMTWAEHIEMVKKLTKGAGANRVYGYVAQAGHTYLMQTYVWSNGGDLVSDDGMTTVGYMDSPQAVEAVKYYKALYDIGAKTIGTGDYFNIGEAEFMSGKVAMHDTLQGLISDLKRTNPNLRYGTTFPPVPTKGAKLKPVIHIAQWAIAPYTKHPDEAWELMKAASMVEGAESWAKQGWLTGYRGGLKYLAKTPEIQTFIDEAELAENVPCFLRNPRWFEADMEFQKALQEIMVNNADIQKSLTRAAKAAQEILRRTE